MRSFALALLIPAGLLAQTGLTNVSAASYQGPAAAPGSIAAAYGANLAATTEGTPSAALPQSLAGTSVKVKDSAGVERIAVLFFVSPGQVNYLVPEETAAGPAVVTVANGQGATIQGTLAVAKVAPGLFSVNGDGKGVAAATAIHIAPDNVQTYSAVFSFDAALQKYVPAPIDMGSAADRVYLTLYGTGIRHAASVSVTIADQAAPVSWAGAHSVYAGLDQVNVELPRSLEGLDEVAVVLTADGVQSNPVTVQLSWHRWLNLDFETATRRRPWGWTLVGTGYEIYADTTATVSGSQSLRIQNFSAVPPAFGVAWRTFPVEQASGRHIRFSGCIKTDGMTRGWAGLWMRVDGASGTLVLDNMNDRGPSGTTGWRQYQIDLDVSAEATQISFGVLNTGDGTALFDNLAIEIDGIPYQEGSAPYTGEPSAAMVDWVRQAANPFLTPLAGNGLDDLSFVKSMVGDAKIVALGEGTHGTSEFFRMKHRLLEYLATEMGFNIFAIEANMPEAYRLNDYVLYGRGNPKELLKGMYFWTWNTQEVLDMILWMREFNASGRGQLQFTGFDMQTASVAMDIVRSFVQKADPAYLGTLDAAYTLAKSVGYNQTSGAEAAAAAARSIWQYLEQQRSGYLASFSADEVDWAIQNGKIVEQAKYVLVADYGPYRDACMAANFDWILQRSPPGSKAVIWAHNYHVSRRSGAMGSYLAANHDKDYLVVGQIFHEGTYNAVGSGRLGVNDATTSFPGTVEYVFHSTGLPQFILDLRKATRADPGSSWLLGEVEYRSIGAVATDGFFNIKQLPNYYDALVFFDHTTPTVLLP